MLQRDRQPELMDDPDLPESEHRHALLGLSRLNRFSGIGWAMYRRLRRYVPQGSDSIRVLDVASGAGDIPIACALRARQDGLTFHTTMLDISEVAAEEQRRRAADAGVVADSVVQDCIGHALPGGFDVITCSLFMHHLDDQEVVRLLQSMQAASPQAILISDLDRSRINLELVRVASRVVTRSEVVHTDAVRSVRAAYTREEFRELAEQALLRPLQVEAAFPCRFLLTVDDETVSVAVPSFA